MHVHTSCAPIYAPLFPQLIASHLAIPFSSFLRSAFAQSRTVLLFHLKNHYALIFALREWTCTDSGSDPVPEPVAAIEADSAAAVSGSEGATGDIVVESTPVGDNAILEEKLKVAVKPVRRVRRQILTARKGQRPTAWIDFEEARDTMLQWEGYKIIAISYFGDFPCSALSSARVLVPEEYSSILEKKETLAADSA